MPNEGCDTWYRIAQFMLPCKKGKRNFNIKLIMRY